MESASGSLVSGMQYILDITKVKRDLTLLLCHMHIYSHLSPLSIAHNVGVQVDGEVLPADAVVIALGPWTNTLASSLQLPHISGQLGHSIVLKPSSSPDPIPADCLFLSWQSKSGDADTDTLSWI